ncbi:ABC transporter permease [Gemmatimonadetes bacterium T265]|nr:ABC transporter permease [Gemmatimonadetes bacterium T265]
MIVLAFLALTLRIVVPYLLAAAGGVMSERAGVVALALEGFMLAGAFGAATGSHAFGSPWIGVLCGVVGGVLVALLLALAAVRYRADQVVVGIALNLLAVGATRFFLRFAFDSSSNSPRVPGFDGDLTNPVVWIGLATLPAVAWLLYRTPFGLRVRAVGEKPEAATTLGVPVARVRWIAVALSGVLAGLAGAYLALDQHQFTDGMTAGRGFIALAAVIFGRWDPRRVALACVLFAAAEAFEIQLQGAQLVPSQFVEMIPYVLTIVALAGVVGHATPPAGLGRSA